MSSHREAPEISKDPVADNTDVYAFVSPDKPGHGHDHHQLRAAAGPGRRPELLRVRRRRPLLDLHRQRRRRRSRTSSTSSSSDSTLQNPNTFLYNTGPIDVARTSPNWNRRQFYSVTRIDGTARPKVLGDEPAVPAVQHRPALDAELRERSRTRRSTRCRRGEKVFAGQRNDPFFVDLGSIFDLGDLRPFQNLHLIPTPAAPGVDAHEGAQRPLDRDPGADHEADAATARCRPTR